MRRGKMVTKGQLLFQLDSKPQSIVISENTAELQQAREVLKDLQKPRRTPEIDAIKAQIDEVDAQVNLAQIRVQRYKQLYQRQAVQKDTLDEAVALFQEKEMLKKQYQANLKLAQMGSREEQIAAQQAQIQVINAKIAEAQWQLSQKSIRAPAAGIIFDTYYRAGEFVGSQQAVLSLLTPENLRLEFFVPAQRLAQLQVGQKITYLCDGCKQRSEAMISYISPEAQFIPPLVYSRDNSDKIVFRIKADLQYFLQFKPGQPVTVYLP